MPRLIGKEIKDIFDATTLNFINLSVGASGASNCCKVLVLDVKQFGPYSTSCSEFVFYVFSVPTFWAVIFCASHI